MDSLTEGAIASGMKPYNSLVNQVKKWLGEWDSIEEASEHTLEFIPDIRGLAAYLHKTDFYAWLYGYHALFYDLGYTREELAYHLAEWKPIPPREAIKKFSKWKILERPEFDKLDSYSKATTLTAARMTSATIQDGLRPALMSALKQGITLREFKKQVGGKGGKFMNDFHAETIFRTNVNKAYNQGHTESMFHPDIDGLIPGVMFRAIMDMQTTDICMQRDGNVYSKEQISEYGIQPPCHFNCRSTLIPADAQDVEKKGFAAMPTEPASKGFGVFNKVGVKPPAIAPPPITEPIPGIPTTPAPEPTITKPLGYSDDAIKNVDKSNLKKFNDVVERKLPGETLVYDDKLERIYSADFRYNTSDTFGKDVRAAIRVDKRTTIMVGDDVYIYSPTSETTKKMKPFRELSKETTRKFRMNHKVQYGDTRLKYIIDDNNVEYMKMYADELKLDFKHMSRKEFLNDAGVENKFKWKFKQNKFTVKDTLDDVVNPEFVDDIRLAEYQGKEIPIDTSTIEDQSILVNAEHLPDGQQRTVLSGKLRKGSDGDLVKQLDEWLINGSDDVESISVYHNPARMQRELSKGKINVIRDEYQNIGILEDCGMSDDYIRFGGKGSRKAYNEYHVKFKDGSRMSYKGWIEKDAENKLFGISGQLEIITPGNPSLQTVKTGLQKLGDLRINCNVTSKLDEEIMYLTKQLDFVATDKAKWIGKYNDTLKDYKLVTEGIARKGVTKESITKDLYKIVKDNFKNALKPMKAANKAGNYEVMINDASRRAGRRGFDSEIMKSSEWWNKGKDEYYFHHSIFSYSMEEERNVIRIADLLDSGNLISGSDRGRVGIQLRGLGPINDVNTGGSSYTFARARRYDHITPNWETGEVVLEKGLILKPQLATKLDSVIYEGNWCGNVKEGFKAANKTPINTKAALDKATKVSANEIMVKENLNLQEYLEQVIVGSREEKKELIDELLKRGITKFGDKSVEDLVLTMDEWKDISMAKGGLT